MILASAIGISYESINRLVDPQPIERLWLVAVAGVIGFVGNEAVAIFRIRIGREIDSAALVADGQHARADALTSLAVLVGAGGVALGFPIADPVLGLLIGVGILFLAYHSGVQVWRRLTDAVDPELLDGIEHATRSIGGIEDVSAVRGRWLGHRLHADLTIVVDEALSTAESHAVAEEARHRLLHDYPQLAVIVVHVDPCGHSGVDHHAVTSHHDVDPNQTRAAEARS